LHPPPQQHQQRTQAQAHTGRALLWRGRCRGPHPNGQLLRRGQRPASSRVGGVHAAATIAVRERGGGGGGGECIADAVSCDLSCEDKMGDVGALASN